MNKLIELLNESAVLDTIFENEYQVKFRATKIISKELGFIKWLVDNDKIDLDKLRHNEIYFTLVNGLMDIKLEVDEVLLMLLAISDTPIDDLISYLK